MTRAVTLLALVALSCQTYEFQQVRPEGIAVEIVKTIRSGRPNKPNVMMVVDRSGSMAQPIDATQPTGPKRIDELRAATSQFFARSGDSARFGLTFFPARTNQCDATVSVDEAIAAPSAVDDDVADRAKAAAIAAKIGAVDVGGGTPTAASLSFAGQLAALNDLSDGRADVVLLLTDGLPNCNAANANHTCSGSNAACRCTLGALSACQASSAGSIAPCSQGCLDQDNTVATIAGLRQRHITTVVVGFGSDANTGDAAQTLAAMAVAGGFRRSCQGSCPAYFQASTGAALAAALDEIRGSFGEPCELELTDETFDGARLRVEVSGRVIPSTDFEVHGALMTFKGATCTVLHNATPASPVAVSVQLTQPL